MYVPSLGMIQNYRQRISGPLLDRIDINIEVPRVDWLTRAAPRRILCGNSQPGRDGPRSSGGPVCQAPLTCNADMGPAEIREHCVLPPRSQSLISRQCARCT